MASIKDEIHQYLKNGNSITPAIAAEEFNCYCLAAVILKLRKKGITILSEKIEGTQSKRYWIDNAR
ncbi:hypothetical protein AFAEC_0574 [Aliarcobacter faecis]|uniref:helix-turn-helix domain-containing protein n=1 Tax=Aliarcobacter faecis TaxID=1564138 RepID=UPI0004B331C5|nr:helix-turn-helix domain-containing protein [Aliarcobacter faecis]QKF72765.1 hypothetical protein AFAEC_0574 [Aliarcobacter faecis]